MHILYVKKLPGLKTDLLACTNSEQMFARESREEEIRAPQEGCHFADDAAVFPSARHIFSNSLLTQQIKNMADLCGFRNTVDT